MVADQGVDLHFHFGRHGGQLHDNVDHGQQADGGCHSSGEPAGDEDEEHYHPDGLHLHLVDDEPQVQGELRGLVWSLAWLTRCELSGRSDARTLLRCVCAPFVY